MARLAITAALLVASPSTASAQIAISTTTPYVETFDGMGIPANISTASTVPTNFKVDSIATAGAVRTVGTWAAATTSTSARAGGPNVSSTASQGIYNFGAGTAASGATVGGADRSVGFLSSGSGTLSGNLYAQLVNNTGASLTGLQISFNVEKYRGGTNAAGFRIQMYYSTDGVNWTSAGNNFQAVFAGADASNNGAATVPMASSSVTNQTLTAAIPSGSNFYLAWNFSVTSGTTVTNSQALAVDDVSILGLTGAASPTNPSATGSASPTPVTAGNSTTLSAIVTGGTNPASTGLAVTCNLTAIGGSSTFSLPSPGFSAPYAVPAATTPNPYSLPCTVSDAQSRSGNFNIALTVGSNSPTNPSGTGAASPNSLQAGSATLLTVNVTPGTNPPSTGLTVAADLTSIGGSASQQFFDDGTHGDVTSGDNIFSFSTTVAGGTSTGGKSMLANINDGQMRNGSTTISLTVQPPVSTSVKISQVYGGGGNSGATYTNDYIELFNQSTSPVDINGWSVQQASATATAWSVSNLCPNGGTCILQPGHYYLVQEAQGASGATGLPAADITGSINMGATSGKVALVNNTSPLSGACPTGSGIADMVGYGGSGTTCFEGAVIAALSNTTAAVRKNNGCIDTDNNNNDFLIGGPIPRNSSSPVNTCGGSSTLISGVGLAIPAAVDPSGNLLLTVTVTPATSPASTGIAVTGNLSAIGGSASQQFYDDGTHGDVTAGDNIYSFRVAAPTPYGAKSVPTTITDAQSRTAPAPITFTVQSPTCGVERWAVKTGTDTGAAQVDINNPVRTTIKDLRAIPAPTLNANPPYDPRFAPTENTVFVVNGTMTFYKLEDDVDYHIVLQDPVGNTIVTEIPSPACDGSTSPFDAAVAAVRAKFDARFTATSTFQNANVPVQMKGVGFFDFLHGQTGVAPNGIELHPILDITFTAPSTLAIAADVNPSTYGQAVTITGTVTIPSGTPTGTVSFFDAGSLIGTGTIGPNGKATLTTSTLVAGPHTITATYDGDSQASQSSSQTLNLTVNQAATSVTWSAPAAITFGSALGSTQLSATATVPGTFAYTPALGTVLPAGNGQTLSVVFTPTSSNYASSAKSVTIDVLPATTGGSPASLIVTQSMVRTGNQVIATITIANNGGTAASNVSLTTAAIGTTAGTPLPQSLGSIAAGGSVQATVTFPGTVGAAGSRGVLSVSGSYTGGTFSSGARVVLP